MPSDKIKKRSFIMFTYRQWSQQTMYPSSCCSSQMHRVMESSTFVAASFATFGVSAVESARFRTTSGGGSSAFKEAALEAPRGGAGSMSDLLEEDAVNSYAER